ncbi:hypothetical protein HISP_15910 [Haloarcula hispanica N601]|uniref:Acyl-CoA dehydrogenase n=3 Tax=Haloarcula hispanica TaxID=51589 RepID=V5TRH0_HALHI|nr:MULTISPECIES: hypothetical protein [Haloarcula]AEM58695.1 conserved hypothetical protein [Haloarcula hispanica ATCC 33960]AHB67562.1 hypothetical protein HISP_15910 [Haloarcula hispanica N601]AJF24511.1 hypothetical protein SG26_01680 [Haloarcula sp. CBA1115]KAA9401103.1 hypothetical protein Har1131_21150 [Haloarcula sp. CBA1131]KZX48284.1 hypothetical protein AV929_20520 [Haloarcula sp. K1]
MGGDSFKSGSGNLNFGDNDEEEGDDETEEAGEEIDDTADEEADDLESKEVVSEKAADSRDSPEAKKADSTSEESTTSNSTASDTGSHQTSGHKYPYFVRRSNVGDERDNRLELFARDEVVSQEAEFRSQLASELGADDIAKTDAREYALLAAFDNVEDVAELMRGDGYGELD